ncbi:Chimeric ERCC6-PGBD3 protein [Nymphon striatum]|nr:Chimeric ERCC6-PGBD3 protein [Nymphon striatum]
MSVSVCMVGIELGEECGGDLYYPTEEEKKIMKFRIDSENEVTSTCMSHKTAYLTLYAKGVKSKSCADPFKIHKKLANFHVIDEECASSNTSLSTTTSSIEIQSEEDYHDITMDIVELNKSMLAIGESPIKQRKLSTQKRYPEEKLQQIESTIRKKLNLKSPTSTETEDPQYEKELVELIDQLKEKYKESKERSIKMQILTVLPKSWTIRRIEEEFEVSNWMARAAKKLMNEKGAMSTPNPKQGRPMSIDVLNKVDAFYKKGEPAKDKLFKVRPLIESLQKKFQLIPCPQNLCVDEQKVPFKGRSSLKQYDLKKPHKWGYKICVLCNTKGIIYDFEIYSGEIAPVCDYPDLGASSNIVLRLAKIIPKHQSHLLYFDNRFTSLRLMSVLQIDGIYALGTVRQNRIDRCQMPSDSHLIKSGRGSFIEKEGTIEGVDIRLIKWADTRCVTVASTFCGAHPLSTVKRFDKKKKVYVDVIRPNIVKQSAVNAWLLYRRDADMLGIPKSKQYNLVTFKSEIAASFIKVDETVFITLKQRLTKYSTATDLLYNKYVNVSEGKVEAFYLNIIKGSLKTLENVFNELHAIQNSFDNDSDNDKRLADMDEIKNELEQEMMYNERYYEISAKISVLSTDLCQNVVKKDPDNENVVSSQKLDRARTQFDTAVSFQDVGVLSRTAGRPAEDSTLKPDIQHEFPSERRLSRTLTAQLPTRFVCDKDIYKVQLASCLQPGDDLATDIKYHQSCWNKHVVRSTDTSSEPSQLPFNEQEIASKVEFINVVQTLLEAGTILSIDDAHKSFLDILQGHGCTKSPSRRYVKQLITGNIPDIDFMCFSSK